MKKNNKKFHKIKAANNRRKKKTALKFVNLSTSIFQVSKIKKYISLIYLNLRIEL
jgi:hypothetical protein